MKRSKLMLMAKALVLLLCLLVTGCKEKIETEWNFSFHSSYISDACYAHFDQLIQSKTGRITLTNTNEFPIYVYLYNGFLYSDVAKTFLIDPNETIEYLIDDETTYTVGIKVAEKIGAFSKIDLSIKAI